MKRREAFPSNWLAAADLNGSAVKVTIASVEPVKIGEDEKIGIKFIGKEKGIICNVTNWNAIEDAYGEESDDWIGKEIELYPTRVDLRGKLVDAIRVRTAAQPLPPSAENDDDIPC